MPPEAPTAPVATLNEPLPPVRTPDQKLYEKPPEAPPETPAMPLEVPKAPEPAKSPEPAKPDLPPETPPAAPPTPPPEAKKAPADYTLELPSGSPLTKEDLAKLTAEAKEQGLDKEAAEGLLQVKDETARTIIDRQNKAYEEVKSTWKNIVANDPEIGGEAQAKNVELAKRAWDKLASPELKLLANQTGLGSHPEVVRLMVRIGNIIGEDQLVRGTVGPLSAKRNPEDILYANPLPASEPMK